MDYGGVPDSISGWWFPGSIDKRLADEAGHFLRVCDSADNSARESGEPGHQLPAEPRLFSNLWGLGAKLGHLRAVADLRIDRPAELASILNLDADSADGPASLMLHGWKARGSDLLSLIEGDFAIAVWDEERRELVLARDALGQRPLHYRRRSGGIAFASTAASLACLDGRMEPDVGRIAALLAFIPDFGPRTFVKQVERVMPGHLLRFDRNGEMRQERWWKPRLHPVSMTPEDGVKAMQAEVDRAVASALVTDRKIVAAQLSGGHDSTLVVVTAARLLGPDKNLIAITADSSGEKAFHEGAFDDAAVACETAAILPQVRHVVLQSQPESPMDAADRWKAVDMPMLNPFNLNWLDLSFATARDAGADVMLVGISGNVTVSPWGVDLLNILAKTGRWVTLVREMRAYRRHHPASWFGLAGVTLGPWVPTRLWQWISKLRGRDAGRFDDRAFLRRNAPAVRTACRRAKRLGLAVASAPARLTGSHARFAEMRWSDLGVINHFIRARFGVEVRDPLGARRVAELSLQLGPEHFYRDGQGRRLSRALLAGKAPDAVTSESIRRGLQGADWAQGATEARPEMARELELMAADPELSDIFDIDRLRDALDRWPDGGWEDGDQSESYRLLVAGIAAGRWARRTRERKCEGSPA